MSQAVGSRRNVGGTIFSLGKILGVVINAQCGPRVFRTEEALRRKARGLRRRDDLRLLGKLRRKIGSLDDELLRQVSRAYTVFILLLHLAEEHDANERARAASVSLSCEPLSLSEAMQTLKRRGVKPSAITELLKLVEIRTTMTAHPTQAFSQDILRIRRQILEQLGIDESKLTPEDRADYVRRLQGLVEQLHATALVQGVRPTVLDEVRQTASLVADVLFEAVPLVYWHLHRARDRHYPELNLRIPRIAQIGSWPGGDMDGNPNATAEVLSQTLHIHRETALLVLSDEVQRVAEAASFSQRQVPVTQELQEFLRQGREMFPELGNSEVPPYRLAFLIIYRRLLATHYDNGPGTVRRSYGSPRELWLDIGIIQHALRDGGMNDFADYEVAKFRRQVDLFGFHLASLDVRRNSPEHQAALDEMFAAIGELPAGTYAAMPEAAKQELINRWLVSRRPLLSTTVSYSEPTQRVLDTLQIIADAHRSNGPRAIENYIVSHTEQASDVLEVLLLMKEMGLARLDKTRLRGEINIVPLFETVEDFANAETAMRLLYTNRVYRGYIGCRSLRRRQIVMLGFSDGAKSAGLLSATWEINKLQARLTALAEEQWVIPIFFHGRGGSTARGGGLRHQAILTQPGDSGRLMVTVQGEDRHRTCGTANSARSYLERMVYAAIMSAAGETESAKLAEADLARWSGVLDQISAAALKRYQELVGHSRFVEFFYAATPIAEWAELPIGSRPTSRKKNGGGLDALRAIPWVAAWSQSRIGAAAWFGAGSGLVGYLNGQRGERRQRLETLREMYQSWPFFRLMIDSIERGLAVVDMSIGEEFAKLVSDGKLRREMMGMLREEFECTVKAVCEIKQMKVLLGRDPEASAQSKRRLPYLKVISLATVEFLRRLRKMPEGAERDAYLKRYVLLAICATAAGLNETG